MRAPMPAGVRWRLQSDTYLLTHVSGTIYHRRMGKTRKVQVTLDEAQYECLREIAEREDRSLAHVVRESVVRYCVEPTERRRRQRALDRLSSVEAPVPDDYATWEREYSACKSAPKDAPSTPGTS